jgi:hypothetical protein
MEGHSKTAPRAGERWHDKHDQFFLNFRTTNVQNHRARLLHGMRNRRSLSESHFGGTFLLTLIYDTRSESMDFEDFTMAEKQTALQQIKKLDEERTKLLESAKADALARAEEAINELTALGFDYELVEPTRETAPRKTRTARKASAPDHHPKGTCPICEYATKPPHDKRSHKSQQKKRPFTAEELNERSLVRV